MEEESVIERLDRNEMKSDFTSSYFGQLFDMSDISTHCIHHYQPT